MLGLHTGELVSPGDTIALPGWSRSNIHPRAARDRTQVRGAVGAARCAIGQPRGGPGSASHPWASSASLPFRVAPPPLTKPPFVGRAQSPLPAASVSPAPSASRPSVRCLAARRVQPPPSRFDGPSLSARPPPTGPPRSRSTSRNCPGAGPPVSKPALVSTPLTFLPHFPQTPDTPSGVCSHRGRPVTSGWL
ncbi:unnamed protein product [Rangifer tarandus platyrhynchus]|uniref:Uncharacterized protein n=2 Tax=Rangifer tarandus platyrhynchus TaxID=3082113 RepID=A0ACB0EY48_RANTA|nr:unnamed protein product [Rangifer tarandus platyrhynchus]CAI9705282.1 unnamed protein product [Rangifer tarandus platyrhynchus]